MTLCVFSARLPPADHEESVVDRYRLAKGPQTASFSSMLWTEARCPPPFASASMKLRGRSRTRQIFYVILVEEGVLFVFVSGIVVISSEGRVVLRVCNVRFAVTVGVIGADVIVVVLLASDIPGVHIDLPIAAKTKITNRTVTGAAISAAICIVSPQRCWLSFCLILVGGRDTSSVPLRSSPFS